MLDSMKAQKLCGKEKQDIELTAEGARFLGKEPADRQDCWRIRARPVCKACLDWSERRIICRTLGAAMMTRFRELKWAARDPTPGQPRRQFYPCWRETVYRAFRQRRRLEPFPSDESATEASSFLFLPFFFTRTGTPSLENALEHAMLKQQAGAW